MSLAAGPPPISAPVRHRSTRDRPAKAPLSEDAVVNAALAILKSDGLEAVTMRRVAAALDTGPASLYVYVSGSEGLLQAMLDRVISTIEFEPPDPSRWRAQLHTLLQRFAPGTGRSSRNSVNNPGRFTHDRTGSASDRKPARRSFWPVGLTLKTPPGRATSSCCWLSAQPVRTMCGVLPGRAVTATASRSTSSIRPSSACRPTDSLISLPMLRTWSLAMATSGFISPSTFLSMACSPERPDGKRSAASAPSSTSGFCCVPPHARRPRSPGTGAAFAPNDRPQQRSHSTSFSRQPGRRARRRHHQPHRRRSPDLPPGG